MTIQMQEIKRLQEELDKVKRERDCYETWLKKNQELKERYLKRWRDSQENLEEAIKLLSFVYDHAEQHNPGSVPNEQWSRAFIERVKGGDW